MSFTKKHLVVAIAMMSVFALVVTGIPGALSGVAFANLYGAASSSSNGVTATAAPTGDGACAVTISGETLGVGSGSSIGGGAGGFVVVKNTTASENPRYQVIQINSADNSVEFEVWIDTLSSGCAVRGI